MGQPNSNSTRTRYRWVQPFINRFTRIFVPIWLLGVVGLLFTIGILSISGQFTFDIDAEITQLAVCLDEKFQPVDIVPIGRERFYICGFIEGTTRFSASLAILRNGTGVYGQNFNEKPGYFFVPIDLSRRFSPGEYTANLGRYRQTVASTEFSLVEN